MIYEFVQRLKALAGAFTKDRLTREEAKDLAKIVAKCVKRYCGSIQIAGSYRRGATSIGDLDFVVTDADLGAVLMALVEKLGATKAPRAGNSVMTVLVPYGRKKIQVEFVSVKERSVGAGLIHSTGGAEFNVGLRSLAKSMGMLLNQHGLFDAQTKKFLAGRTEESVFKKLGLHFIPPKDRNDGLGAIKDKYSNGKKTSAPPQHVPEGKVWKVKSLTTDQVYYVSFRDGKWSCGCKGFAFNGMCAHINKVKDKVSL